MSAPIKLTITNGRFAGREFVFEERTLWTIGRSHDCDLQLPSDEEYLGISRHHCLLDIDPPEVRIRDCGSRNGTFVNGSRIGQREGGPPVCGLGLQTPEFHLHSGDEVRIGALTFRVTIVHAAETFHAPDAELVAI